MAEELRIECPHCKTSYTGARCGIALADWQFADVTIVCLVCGQFFNAHIKPREVVEAVSWWRRVVLQQQPEKYVDGHTVTVMERADGSNDVGAALDSSSEPAGGPDTGGVPVE